MGDTNYIYSQENAEMREKNLNTANRELQKLNKQAQSIFREMNLIISDVDAVAKGWVPSERHEPNTIHGVQPMDWFFKPVNIGDCHDCPLESAEHNSRCACRCGANRCIVRQLCELQGLIDKIR